MLDDNIDPTMALQMTGLTFQDNSLSPQPAAGENTRIDPRCLEMVQARRNLFDDEELGLTDSARGDQMAATQVGQLPLTAGYPIAEDRSQKLVQQSYENWLRKNLTNLQRSSPKAARAADKS